jgi:hypothetical protein
MVHDLTFERYQAMKESALGFEEKVVPQGIG